VVADEEVVGEEEEEEEEEEDGCGAVCCPRLTVCGSGLLGGDVMEGVVGAVCSLARTSAADGGDCAAAAALADDVRRLGGGMGREEGCRGGGDDWEADAARDAERRSHDHQRRSARATRC
jgi:hypothetical protein